METPPLSHRKFQILCALIDGREKGSRQVRDEIGYHPQATVFSRQCRQLQVDGLIERHDVVHYRTHSATGRRLDRRERFQTLAMLKITEAGREAWRETADWYLYYIERFAGESPPQADAEELAVVTRMPHEPNLEAEERARQLTNSWNSRMTRLNRSLNRNAGDVPRPGRPPGRNGR